jgi:TatD DNase family protein
MFIDTHAHLNFETYRKDLDKVIKRSLENNISFINVGTSFATSKKACEIADGKNIFASVGLHPINLDTELIKMKKDELENPDFFFEKEFEYKKYSDLIVSNADKVVAVGEIGLDYWYRPKSKKKRHEFKNKQLRIFLDQVKLADELSLPLVLHCRLAYEDLLDELSKISNKEGGVIHCFCGTLKEAQEFVNLGYSIGVNGIIFKLDLDTVIKNVPLEKMVLETDCPYLSPPQVKDERNEPINLKYIAEKIAKVKNIDSKKVESITTNNAKELFGI